MNRSGFTLLEVVIAAAATAALTVTALSVLGAATAKWTRLQRAATTRETAEAIMDRMADDLQSERLADDGTSTFPSAQSAIVTKAIAAGAVGIQVIPQVRSESSLPFAVDLHLTLPTPDGPQSFDRRVWIPTGLP